MSDIKKLVGELDQATLTGEIVWEQVACINAFTARYKDIDYCVDYPQDGKPSLVVDCVLVFEGYDLREFFVRVAERSRVSAVPMPSTSVDCRVSQVVAGALATFKKR